ncbi:MAG: hypothetical protein RL708_480 [Bacteroidota bacterium]|jgi:hypothetical protein
MKKIYTYFILLLTTISIAKAQLPKSFNYQAVVRDASGNVAQNQNVSFRFSILDASSNGTPQYVETANTTTNQFGLATLNIGSGTIVSGTMNGVSWGNGIKFLKVELDALGGSSFNLMSSTQLLAVPFSIVADTVLHSSKQKLSISHDTIGISNGNKIKLPSSATLHLVGTGLTTITGSFPNDTIYSGGDGWGSQTVNSNATLSGAGTTLSALQIAQQGATTGQVLKWNGTTWLPANDSIGSSSGNWSTTGNLGTTASNYIGTKDKKPMYFRINNVWAGKLDSTNLSFGYKSGLNSFSGGSGNTAFGNGAMQNGSNMFNTAVGTNALRSNSNYNNSAVGFNALYANTSGQDNTGVGTYALSSNKTGNSNTAVGSSALLSNTIGGDNTAMGLGAMSGNKSGYANVAIGSYSLFNSKRNNTNVSIGAYSLYSDTSGYSNIAIGISALLNNIGKSKLIAIGDSALMNNSIGASASYQGKYNLAIGSKALMSNNIGYSNTALGYEVLYNNTTGQNNVGIGWHSLFTNNTGSGNVSLGDNSLAASSTGLDNSALGYYALAANTTGSGNSAFGEASLTKNTIGNNNTALGYLANTLSNNLSNATAVGANARVGKSNAVSIGDTATATKVNVGIGTAYPNTTLDVRGTFSLSNGTTYNKLESGEYLFAGPSATQATTFTFTFPKAFSAAPKIVATVVSANSVPVSDVFVLTVRSISATSVTFNILRIDTAAGWSQNLKIDWTAWE